MIYKNKISLILILITFSYYFVALPGFVALIVLLMSDVDGAVTHY